ncbi:MAG TPA: hypothetical protein VFE45_04315 [Coriobacteriia bacterium]|nr:hypothetical protein [Coriobacteriia bacterium]
MGECGAEQPLPAGAQRTRPDVERMLAASDFLFAIIEKGSDFLVAFAPVLTDRTYLALVLDVTSRPAVDRLLDPANRSVTLATLERAASAVGKKLRVELT